LGTPISDGLKSSGKWDASLGKWIPDNEITAEQVSTDHIRYWSNGDMEQSNYINVSGINFITITYVIPFNNSYKVVPQKGLFPSIVSRLAVGAIGGSVNTAVGYVFMRMDTGSQVALGTGSNLSWMTKGKY
jgi:hypothetical protein